ncbi:hypothetical protein V6858_004004 [Providencia rettgeri]|uniref:hypothetical protein n=1 Tax=Providencia rettgeri TaxID=587 RepID=UPI0015D55A44|nr:hypothetical protein H0A34_05530 [Providencia rettgeri]
MSPKIDAIQLAYRVLDGEEMKDSFTYEEMRAVCCYLDRVVIENLALTQCKQPNTPNHKDF